MRFICFCLGSLLVAGSTHGESFRTAVLTSETLRNKPYGLLLTVELGNRGVALVERAELDRIVAEQELSAFGGDAATSRIRIGRLLGAGHLVLLDSPTEGGSQPAVVRLRVIDVATGLRLGSAVVPVDSQEAVEASGRVLADAVSDVRERFPEGVEWVVAVTPWLSENLTREYDAMQMALAELLITALQGQKGLAVVEVEEARRVARERLLGGIDAPGRPGPAPWVVGGRFKLNPVKHDEARNMDLTMNMYRIDTEEEPRIWQHRNVRVEHVGSLVNEQAASAVLETLALRPPDRPTDTRKLFEALIGRADRFTTLGMWAEAASLREAALVADPENEGVAAQRLATAWEYARLLGNGFIRGLPDPKDEMSWAAWLTTFRESHALWRRALWHAEFLIMNRQLDNASAFRIAEELLSIPRRSRDIRDGTAQVLIAADADRRRFILNVLPRGLDLPPAATAAGKLGTDLQFAGLALDSAVEPYYGKATPSDLGVFAALLISKLPGDLPPNGQFVRFHLGTPRRTLPDMHYSGTLRPDVEAPASTAQWDATMRRLASQSKQERSVAWALGEYALLAQERWQVDRNDSERQQALYERALTLEAEWRSRARPGAGSNDGLAAAIEELRKQLRPRAPTASAQRPPPTNMVEPPENTITHWLEPVNLRSMLEDGTQTELGMDWFDVLPVEGRPQGLLNIWVGGGSVFFERTLGELVLDLKFPQNQWISSARWDGRYAWIANPYQGIYLLDAAGYTVAMFDGAAGLPEATWKILVQPLAEGRAIAVGTTRQDSRSWIAELWLDEQGRPRVKVIHSAIKQSGWEDRRERQTDPDATGSYEWIWLWDRGGAGRYLIVGRSSGYSPLAVNLVTHDVTVIGQPPLSRGVVNPFWGGDPRWYSLHMLTEADGTPTNLLLGAGTFGVVLVEVGDEPVGANLTFKQIDQWSSRDSVNMGNMADGRLIPQTDGSIIFSGYGGGGWARIRVDTAGAVPRFLVQPLCPTQFPGVYDGSTAPATGHGFLLWGLRGSQEHEGKVLRAKLPDPPEKQHE